MAKQKNHIHKFRRHTYKNGTTVFFCTLDDCMSKIGTEFTLGKTNICWRCGKPFTMTAYSMSLAKPHCVDCHKSKLGSSNVTNSTPTTILDRLDERFTESIIKPENDRRELTTRRDFDPTILAINAEESIESLKSRLSVPSVTKSVKSTDEIQSTVYKTLEIEDEDVEL